MTTSPLDKILGDKTVRQALLEKIIEVPGLAQQIMEMEDNGTLTFEIHSRITMPVNLAKQVAAEWQAFEVIEGDAKVTVQ